MTESPPTKSSLTAWERWELASFETPRKETASEAAASAAAAIDAEQIARLQEAARQQGLQAGTEAGYAAGYAEGQRIGEIEAIALGRMEAEHLLQVVQSLESRIADLNVVVADELVALSIALAGQVVRETIAARPEVLLTVVREALMQMPLQHAAIHLNPEDASLVRSRAGDQLTHAGHRIHEDPKLARGDVVIESGGSHLDATLATRWRRAVESLGQDVAWVDAAKP